MTVEFAVARRRVIVNPHVNWHDIWIGVYWKYDDLEGFDAYVCILPCLPIYISVIKQYR